MFRRGQSAKLRAALPGIIITIVVLIGLMVVEVSRSSALNPVPPTTALSADR